MDEFQLIEKLIKKFPAAGSLVENGDDAAIIEGVNQDLVVSVDAFVESVHFSFDYSTPEQVGQKCIEAACSDIVAMGAKPRFILLTIGISKTQSVDVLETIYDGIRLATERCEASLLGGDTVAVSDQLLISVTAIGYRDKAVQACRRADAVLDDFVFVSGQLGGAMAGLWAYENNLPDFDQVKELFNRPLCRIDIVDQLAPYANAMIDISDGLSSELTHIANASSLGIEIDSNAIPILEEAERLFQQFDHIPVEVTLNAGEDYELLYTISEQHLDRAVGYNIGRVVSKAGVRLLNGERSIDLHAGGWNHFNF